MQALYGYGLTRQARDVDQMAADQQVYLPDDLRFRDGVDDNASGVLWNLPELERMTDLARAGRFKTLLVPATDRWTRDHPKGVALTQQMRNYGVRVIWGDLPIVPMGDEDNPHARHWQRKMESDAFMEAEYEKDKIRWRTMHARRDKASLGRIVGSGTAPYGYRYVRDDTPKHRICGLAPVEVEAKVVGELYERALTSSLRQLMVWLEAERIPPPGSRRTYKKPRYGASAGVEWVNGTIYDILTSRTYIGEFMYRGTVIPCPSLVTELRYQDVQAVLAKRRGRRGAARLKTADDEFLFRGRLLCAPCSAALDRPVYLHSRCANAQGDRYYVCPQRWERNTTSTRPLPDGSRCPLPSIRAEVLEDQVWQSIITTCLDPQRMTAQLDEARKRRQDDDQGREDRRAAIQTSIAQQQRLLAVHVARVTVLEAEGTAEAAVEMPLHAKGRDDARSLLVKLQRDLRELEAAPGPGISAVEREAIEQLAVDLREAGEGASATIRRQAVALLGLRASVGEGDEQIAVQLKGRSVTVAMRWSGAITLPTPSSDCAVSFLKFTLQLLQRGIAFQP